MKNIRRAACLVLAVALCMAMAGCPAAVPGYPEPFVFNREWAVLICPGDWRLDNEIGYEDRDVHFAYFSSRADQDLRVTVIYTGSPNQWEEPEDRVQWKERGLEDKDHLEVEVVDELVEGWPVIRCTYRDGGRQCAEYHIEGQEESYYFYIETAEGSRYRIEEAMEDLLKTAGLELTPFPERETQPGRQARE